MLVITFIATFGLVYWIAQVLNEWRVRKRIERRLRY
jgi:hypothetical protein